MKYYDNIHWNYDEKSLAETLGDIWNDFEPQEYKVIYIFRLDFGSYENMFTVILELEKPLELKAT